MKQEDYLAVDRVLFIDSTPKLDREFKSCFKTIIVYNKDDVRAVHFDYLYAVNPPNILLDLRPLPVNFYTDYLKFIENYKGKIIALVKEPVQPTILSRFVLVIKNAYLRNATFEEGELVQLPNVFALSPHILKKVSEKNKHKFIELFSS